MSDPLTSLVKKIEQQVNKAAAKHKPGKTLGVFVIVNSADGRADQLRVLAQKESLQRVNLCIGTAPQRYDVSPEADVTAVIYNLGRRYEQSVTANFALRKGELDDCTTDAIVQALSEALPK